MITALHRHVAKVSLQLSMKKFEHRVNRQIVDDMNATMQQPSGVFYLDIGVDSMRVSVLRK